MIHISVLGSNTEPWRATAPRFLEFILLMTGPGERWGMEKQAALPTHLFQGRGSLRGRCYVESVPALQLRGHSSRLCLPTWQQFYPWHIISQCHEFVDRGFSFLISERAGMFKWDFLLPGRMLPEEDRAF